MCAHLRMPLGHTFENRGILQGQVFPVLKKAYPLRRSLRKYPGMLPYLKKVKSSLNPHSTEQENEMLGDFAERRHKSTKSHAETHLPHNRPRKRCSIVRGVHAFFI